MSEFDDSKINFLDGRKLNDQAPQFITQSCVESINELALYDSLIYKQHIAPMIARTNSLTNAKTIIGIPFYTELSNILSVLVVMKQCLTERKTNTVIVIVGEFDRSDMVESISCNELTENELYTSLNENTDLNSKDSPFSSKNDNESMNPSSPSSLSPLPFEISIESLWKPGPQYSGKPFSVRALQLFAKHANQGHGANLLIVDADIQFNHWELSCASLFNALLNPCIAYEKTRKHHGFSDDNESLIIPSTPVVPAAMVVLNAPRSFYSDDAAIHLHCYLLTYASLGTHVHQSHGGEFSISASFNKALLADQTLVYRSSYCMESQFSHRALVLNRQSQLSPDHSNFQELGEKEAPSLLLECLMKGKWHAKITLSKLLDVDSKLNARIDLVTEKTFNDAILLKSQLLYEATHTMNFRQGGLSKVQHPNPNDQLLQVLCPIPARRTMYLSFRSYYQYLLNAHLTQGKADLPLDSSFVQILLPSLHASLSNKNHQQDGYRYIVRRIISNGSTAEHSQAEGSGSREAFLFGEEEWSSYTMELINIYQQSQHSRTRTACICAYRLIWLLGTIAFLNSLIPCDWSFMHTILHNEYGPVFRKAFLKKVVGLDNQAIDSIIARDKRHEYLF